jgi:ribosome biogenesis GTPase
VAHDLDEDDVRVRPGRGSRPRTRRTPEHPDALRAVVTAVDRGRYTCRVDGHAQEATAVRAGQVRKDSIVVGDVVDLVGDLTELARIVRLHPRTTVLRRTPDDIDPVERPLVANAELFVVVASVADPSPQPRFIDRCLVAAYDGGLRPLLCLTKSDLGGDADLRARYAPLDLHVVTVSRETPIEELAGELTGITSVVCGSSGVGKSTLVNRLIPGAKRSTGEVGAGGRGRHTTSAVRMLALPGGGDVIDTPGVRSFGLGLVSPARVVEAFSDLATLAQACPPGCRHAAGGTCGLDAAGPEQRSRVDSLRRLLAQTSTGPPVRQ